MKKRLLAAGMALLLCAATALPASAAGLTHTVARGDTMWKIAVKYQVGCDEVIAANPQIANPDLIYPGQKLNIPQLESTVASYEAEVVRLVNAQRARYGLQPLQENWELSRVARYKSQDMHEALFRPHQSHLRQPLRHDARLWSALPLCR